jgi:hypothetical protein
MAMNPVRGAFPPLHVLTLSVDARLVGDIIDVCEERGMVTSRLDSLGSLPQAMGAVESSAAVALLIDAGDSLSDALQRAETLTAIHPELAIVIATNTPRARSENGIRLIDRWRAADRIVDELELAYIGIPAFVSDRRHAQGTIEPVRLP